MIVLFPDIQKPAPPTSKQHSLTRLRVDEISHCVLETFGA